LFHSVFDEIGLEYPDILKEHWIVDIGAAKLADTPEIFDVIVMPNLYGDVLSDVAAQIAGSVGLAGSANIGPECAMFEAIHGSAPRRAGQDMANPSGLLQGAVMMLVHLGQNDVAARIQNAWLTTLENGDHTYDIYQEGKSRRKLGTRSFAEAVISNLGKLPKTLTPVNFSGSEPVRVPVYHRQTPKLKTLVGVDVFLHWRGEHADELASGLQKLSADGMQLKMITNRGIKVWPGGFPETFCTDHWRCRFMGADESIVSARQIFGLMEKLEADGFDCVKTENLYLFDGKPGFSQGQGQ
jgi:isocitrate dehydrogenase